MIHLAIDCLGNNIRGERGAEIGAALQALIDQLHESNSGGTIWIVGDISVNRTIYMRSGIRIEGCKSKVFQVGDNPIFQFRDCSDSSIRESILLPSANQLQPLITLSPGPGEICQRNIIEGLLIFPASASEYCNECIRIQPDSGVVRYNTLRDMKFNDLLVCLYLDSSNGDITCNIFENFFIDRYINGVVFKDGLGRCDNNTFIHIKLQSRERNVNLVPIPAQTKSAFYNISGRGNRFDHCLVWDWGGAAPRVADGLNPFDWIIGDEASGTYVCNFVQAGLDRSLSPWSNDTLWVRCPVKLDIDDPLPDWLDGPGGCKFM